MKQIRLTQGMVALVDDEDFEWLSRRKWFAHKIRNAWYAASHGSDGRFYMHRVIMNAPTNKLVDHVDGDGLNNQKNNLRFASNAENLWNQDKHKNNTSGYKGVHFDKKSQIWIAQIRSAVGQRNIGQFSTPQEAAHAYDEAAKELHGQFAHLNFKD